MDLGFVGHESHINGGGGVFFQKQKLKITH